MKVVSINQTIRLSKELPDKSWKSVELGGEATLEPGETVEAASTALYAALRTEMGRLWKANGVSHEQASTPPASQPEPAKNVPSAPAPVNRNGNGQLATDKQVKAIIIRARKAGVSLDALKAEHGSRSLEQLTKKEASALIDRLAS